MNRVIDLMNYIFPICSVASHRISIGAMDVLEVDSGKDPWNPNPATLERLHKWLAEAHRVLAPQGVLISLSFAQPHFRRYEDLCLCTCSWFVGRENGS